MPDWSTPLLLRGLAATGVLVLLVGGGLVLANRGAGTGTPSAGSAPANHPAGRPISAPQHSSANVPTSAGAGNVRYPTGAGYAYASAKHTGANYSAANLASGVRQEITSSVVFSNNSSGPSTYTPLAIPNRSTRPLGHDIGRFSIRQLGNCLAMVAGGHPVLLVDVARYLGKPAVIVVLKPVHSAFRVVVAGLACGARHGDVLRTLSIPMG